MPISDLISNEILLARNEKIYIFFLPNGWYPMSYRDDEAARNGAKLNPGIDRIEDVDGRVVWTRVLH